MRFSGKNVIYATSNNGRVRGAVARDPIAVLRLRGYVISRRGRRLWIEALRMAGIGATLPFAMHRSTRRGGILHCMSAARASSVSAITPPVLLGVGRDDVRIMTDRDGGAFGAHHLLPNQATHTTMA